MPHVEQAEVGLSHVSPLNAELNPTCQLLALLGAHHILHGSRIRVNMPQLAVEWKCFNSAHYSFSV